ncbi:MAG TPA: hypothetical protein VFE45_05270, partial [Coriobacteriia bacterium]|nr:hypothetical protein [Coriobacteriia bacterium]
VASASAPVRARGRTRKCVAAGAKLDPDDPYVANALVRDVGAGRANAIVCGSLLSRALRVRPSISAEYRAES